MESFVQRNTDTCVVCCILGSFHLAAYFQGSSIVFSLIDLLTPLLFYVHIYLLVRFLVFFVYSFFIYFTPGGQFWRADIDEGGSIVPARVQGLNCCLNTKEQEVGRDCLGHEPTTQNVFRRSACKVGNSLTKPYRWALSGHSG